MAVAAAWWAVLLVVVSVAAVTTTTTTMAKECTNIPTELSSHTVRARLQASPAGAAEWRWRELFHEHLNPTDEAAWMDLMPPPKGGLHATAAAGHHHQEEELDWVMLYRSLKGQVVGGGAAPASASASDAAAAGAGPFLEEVSLHDVRLDPDGDDAAAYGRAQRTNLEYLLLLDVDRLVWSFRTQAGLPAPGEPYGGWEKPDSELRGHFVGTHTYTLRPIPLSLLCLSRSPARACIDRPKHAHAEMLRRHVPGRPAGHGHAYYCAPLLLGGGAPDAS